MFSYTSIFWYMYSYFLKILDMKRNDLFFQFKYTGVKHY